MSTSLDNEEKIVAQISAEAPEEGFVDPDGVYPREDYWYDAGTNKGIRNKKYHKLKISNGIEKVDIDFNKPLVSEYPLVDIKETRSGHVLEFNDTIANERILLKHSIGSGVDIRPDGTIVVNAVGQKIDIVDGNRYLSVEGDGHINYYGNLSLNVSGDLDMDVGGDFYLRVAGSWMIEVLGNWRQKVVGHMQSVIQKSRSFTVLGDAIDTVLGSVVQLTKGSHEISVSDDINIHAGKSGFITAAEELNQTAPNVNIAADNISCVGAVGTIGGDDVIMYNKNMFTKHTVHSEVVKASSMYATTFFGDLVGDAERAVRANVAAGRVLRVGAVVTKLSKPINYDETARPTPDLMTEYTENSSLGYKKVYVDPTNELRNQFDKTSLTDGMSERDLTTSEVRARMKDAAFRDNEKFTKEQLATGALSPSFGSPTGGSAKRSVARASASRLESQPIRRVPSDNKVQPRENPKSQTIQLLPASEFNANNFQTVGQTTKLGKNLPISKFLGSTGAKKSISKIEDTGQRLKIARNLFPHTIIFSIFKSTEKFNEYNLVIAEGVHIPLDTEKNKLNKDSFLSKSIDGRAVAYEVYDMKGQLSIDKTFEFAEVIKDFAYYDTLEIRYDTYGGELHAQIGVTTPEIDGSYKATFKMQVATYFNDYLQSGDDIIDIRGTKFSENSEFSTNPSVSSVDQTRPASDPNVPESNENIPLDNSVNGELGTITTKSGKSTSVAKVFVPNFQGLIDDLESQGYDIRSIGGYANRNIAGSSSKSWHAHGAAIDINPSDNYVQYGVSFDDGTMVTDMPQNIRELCRKHGLGWGGDWSRKKDPMHFSAAKNEGGDYTFARNGKIPKTIA